jgi:hypothetical protein
MTQGVETIPIRKEWSGEGTELFCAEAPLTQLTTALVERPLEAEMIHQFGYATGPPEGRQAAPHATATL